MQENMIENKQYKVAVVAPAPFYYHVPLYRKLAESSEVDLMVYYCSDESIRGSDIEKTYLSKGHLTGNNILSNYKYKFLKNYSFAPSYLHWPFGLINLGIWKEIKNNKYDAVVLQAWTNLTWWIAFFACLRYKTPVLFMTDANITSEYSRTKIKKQFKKITLKFLFKRTAGFLTSGTANEGFYKYYGVSPDKMARFHFSWGYEDFLDKAQKIKLKREELRKSLNIGKDDFVILYVGRLSGEKNPNLLLEAFNNLNLKNKKLFFVGDGPLRKEIEEKIEALNITGVTITGFQNRDAVVNFYAVADVFVLPSNAETWGIVVNEAMCFNLPIIVSENAGATPDLVKNGENGFSFPAEDLKKLTECINKISDLFDTDRIVMGKKSDEIIRKWIFDVNPISQIERFIRLPIANYETPAPFVSKNTSGKKMLMISPYVPWPLYGGTLVRIFNIVKELSDKGYEITLLSGVEKESKINDGALQGICKSLHYFSIASGNSLTFKIRSIFSFAPYPVLKFQTKSFKKEFKKILTSHDFDLIWVNLSVMLGAIPMDLVKDTPIILDHPECEELVYEGYIKDGNVAVKIFSWINLVKFIWFHKVNFKKPAKILCVSEEEADFTRKQVENSIPVEAIPNGVDTDFFAPATRPKIFSNRIIFCSSMNIRRNIDAAVWFAKEVFPSVKEKIADAEFWIVGSNPTNQIQDLAMTSGITVTGTVENIRDYYYQGDVFVAPYHFGAGTKLKVLEAMACGIPVVSTSIGCRGINGMVDGSNFLLADSENDFSKSVISLLEDHSLAESLSENAIALIEKSYSWKKIANDLVLRLQIKIIGK